MPSTKKPEMSERLAFRLDAQLAKRVYADCKRQSMTLTEWMRAACREKLMRNKTGEQ
jgi:hypothetical protein